MSPDLKVESCILVHVGGLEDTVDSLLFEQGNRTRGFGVGGSGSIHDLLA